MHLADTLKPLFRNSDFKTAAWHHTLLVTRLFFHQFVQVDIKESLKKPFTVPLWWVIGGFPSRKDNNAGRISMTWYHHPIDIFCVVASNFCLRYVHVVLQDTTKPQPYDDFRGVCEGWERLFWIAYYINVTVVCFIFQARIPWYDYSAAWVYIGTDFLLAVLIVT